MTDRGPQGRGVEEPAALRDGLRRAVRASVRRGDIVLDVAGGMGIEAFETCRNGASTAIVAVSSRHAGVVSALAAENGLGDRIVVHARALRDLQLSARASLMIATGLDPFVGEDALLSVVAHAREHWLSAGARIVPGAVRFRFQLAEIPGWYARRIDRWNAERGGISFAPGRVVAANTIWQNDVATDTVLAPAADASVVSLGNADGRCASAVSFMIERAGTVHAVSAQMQTQLTPDSEWTPRLTSDGRAVAGFAVFPLERPIAVTPGAGVELSVRMDTVAPMTSLWTWGVTAVDAQGATIGRSQQSTFRSLLIGRDALAQRGPDFAPQLTTRGEAARAFLGLIAEGVDLRGAVARVMTLFPDVVPTPEAGERFAERVLARLADIAPHTPESRPAP
jgi:hypothetical protein